MKQKQLLLLLTFIITASCSNNPEKLLNLAQVEILSHSNIEYKQQALYPNPVGKIDTIESSTSFRKNEKSIFGYDFILRGKNVDNVNIDGIFKNINHSNTNIELFPDNESEKVRNYIEGIRDIQYSPISLLKKTNWKFIGDTIINKQRSVGYFRVESDTIIDGSKLYTEQHIFLNPDSKLIESWERRNYFKGELSQKVVFNYSDYKLDNTRVKLAYEFPPNYPSVLYGKANNSTLLEVGGKAPLLSSKDLQNNSLNLGDYVGKKIVLNFSSIGCGYSHEAMKYINENNILVSDEYTSFYLSIWDKKDDVKDYFTKMNSQFIVIPNAGELAEVYGVSSTPTFFLIDEKGIIENVVIGNDKQFLMNLKSKKK